MINQLQSQLLTATSSTFEELGFVFPETELTECQADAPLTWRAQVSFHGPLGGSLEIRVSEDVVDELATNMLGLTEDVHPRVKVDALGEIANVICGNVVPALGSPEDVFDLDAPVVTSIAGGAFVAPSIDAAVHLQLGIDAGRAELWVVLHEDAGVEVTR